MKAWCIECIISRTMEQTRQHSSGHSTSSMGETTMSLASPAASKKLNMSTNGMTVKEASGEEWEDKGIERM